MNVRLKYLKGREALKELVRKAKEVKKKYYITFDRDAEDPYQAILAVIEAMDKMLEECKEYKKIKMLIKAVAEEKGEKKEEGTYVWPKHLKEAAEEIGVEWELLKEILKNSPYVEFDQKSKKYVIKNL